MLSLHLMNHPPMYIEPNVLHCKIECSSQCNLEYVLSRSGRCPPNTLLPSPTVYGTLSQSLKTGFDFVLNENVMFWYKDKFHSAYVTFRNVHNNLWIELVRERKNIPLSNSCMYLSGKPDSGHLPLVVCIWYSYLYLCSLDNVCLSRNMATTKELYSRLHLLPPFTY